MLAAGRAAWAIERFPPPDFETGHQLPPTERTAGNPGWYDALDITVLFAALSVGAWLVLKARSRKGVVGLAIACLVYFGFWRNGCVCAIGSIQNVTLALFDSGYALPVVVGAFFLLPIAFTLLFGRVFCAGVCPLGAIQDLVSFRALRVPEWLEQPLRVLPYVYLALAVVLAATGSAFVICEYDPFVGIFRLSGGVAMIVFGVVLLAAGMFVVRPYCRYLCPYGVVLGWLSRASLLHARIDPTKCIKCRLCEDSCPVNAINLPDERVDVQANRRRLVLGLAVLPVFVLAGALLGYGLASPLSRMNTTVQLAERMHAEQAGAVEGVIKETEAFRATGASVTRLYADALAVRRRFAWLTPTAFALLGLMVGLKRVRLSVPAWRDEYEIEASRCVACARCFEYCPHDARNVALLQQLTAEQRDDPEVVALTVGGIDR